MIFDIKIKYPLRLIFETKLCFHNAFESLKEYKVLRNLITSIKFPSSLYLVLVKYLNFFHLQNFLFRLSDQISFIGKFLYLDDESMKCYYHLK